MLKQVFVTMGILCLISSASAFANDCSKEDAVLLQRVQSIKGKRKAATGLSVGQGLGVGVLYGFDDMEKSHKRIDSDLIDAKKRLALDIEKFKAVEARGKMNQANYDIYGDYTSGSQTRIKELAAKKTGVPWRSLAKGSLVGIAIVALLEWDFLGALDPLAADAVGIELGGLSKVVYEEPLSIEKEQANEVCRIFENEPRIRDHVIAAVSHAENHGSLSQKTVEVLQKTWDIVKRPFFKKEATSVNSAQ
jgi:hypothetical protein